MNFKVGAVEISNRDLCVIAEAGVNHNGSLESAKELSLSAKRAGASIVKFQTYKSEKLSSPLAKKFWNKTGDQSTDQNETYSKLDSFTFAQYKELKKYCDSISIEFMSTPFDIESVDMLLELGVNAFKIASCDINNFQLIAKVCDSQLPIFLSTGASEITEIVDAVTFIGERGNPLCIMHCVLCYPTPIEQANLNSILFLREQFPGHVVGFSDHTEGTQASILSVACGARVIEKHFTTKKDSIKLGDHWFAVDEPELAEIVREGDRMLTILGDYNKSTLEVELLAREQARRSIHSAKNLSVGHVIGMEDLIMLRPGNGIKPQLLNEIIGMKLLKDIPQYSLIHFEDLQK